MEISLVIPETLYIPDSWITAFVIVTLCVIGWQLKKVIIFDETFEVFR